MVDGDLDLLIGSAAPALKRLLVLSRYSIENFLIDKNALLTILDEEEIEKTRPQIEAAFEFENWLSGNAKQLFDLFVIYAIAREKCPDCATVSYPVNKLVSSNQGIVDAGKVAGRKSVVEKTILGTITQEQLEGRIAEIVAACPREDGGLLSYISGKDYLLPLLFIRMRSAVVFRADNSVIKQRLAMRCDLSELAHVMELVT